MNIVDAQIHIWANHAPERPWPADGFGREHLKEPLTAETVIAGMDEAGVAAAVLVPPSWEGDRNDLALAAAGNRPDRFAVMGRFPLEDPAGARRLAGWRDQPGMLGVRLTFLNDACRRLLAEDAMDWFWSAASDHNLPVMVAPPGQTAAIDRVAGRFPGVRLVIDHLAIGSELRDEAAFARLDEVLALARHANVAVKASALPCATTAPYPFAPLHEPIRRVVAAFGPERVFWGTDLSRLPCPYRQAVTLFTEELDFLTDSDKALIMGEGIRAWLGWRR